MSKFIKNSHGIMGLTLSHIGLFIATGILLAAVGTVIFYNNWQRTEELHAIANSVSMLIQDMDARFFDNITMFQFPNKNYQYTVELSTEYIAMSAKGYWGHDISVKERFIIHPWPRDRISNWTTGGDLHTYLNETYGRQGTKDDPLPMANLSEIDNDHETSVLFFALQPLKVRVHAPLYVEKVSIYDDTGGRHDFILVYQSI